jgi:hypothetical protein
MIINIWVQFKTRGSFLITHYRHSILARLENSFFDKSVLEMFETSLYSLHEQFKPWACGIAAYSPVAHGFDWLKVVIKWYFCGP